MFSKYSKFANGGTDLTGLGVDNRITRWNGPNTVQSSLVDLIDAGLFDWTQAGGALTGTNYQIGRNNAATEELQYNVPTGSAHVLSVNGSTIARINATGIGVNTAPAAKLHTLNSAITDIGGIFQYLTGQTANVLEIRNQAGTPTTYYDSKGALILTLQGANSRQSAVDFANFSMTISGTTNILRFQGSATNVNNNTNFNAVDGALSIRHSSNTLISTSSYKGDIEIRMSGTGRVTDASVFNANTSDRSSSASVTITRLGGYNYVHLSTATSSATIGELYAFRAATVSLFNENVTTYTFSYMANAGNFSTGTGVMTNQRGLVIENLSFATTNNTPIWLKGDGLGGAIRFGANTTTTDGDAGVYWDATNNGLYLEPDINNTGTGRVLVGITSAVSCAVGGTLTVDTTQTGNVGTGEDDLVNYTLPASVLNTNGEFIEIEAAGTFAANGNNKELRLRFGSTLLADTTAVAANSGSWKITARVYRTGAATQKAIADILSDNALVTDLANYTTPTETLSGTIAIRVTGEATNDNDIVIETFHVKFYPNN